MPRVALFKRPGVPLYDTHEYMYVSCVCMYNGTVGELNQSPAGSRLLVLWEALLVSEVLPLSSAAFQQNTATYNEGKLLHLLE